MPYVRLAFLGFGNVGRALARLLLRKRTALADQHGITFTVTGIQTARHGGAIHPGGLGLDRALKLSEAGESLSGLSEAEAPADSMAFIRSCPADVLFENTPVDYQTGQPALDHLRAALEAGMHAVTANKGPVVHGYRALRDLAARKGRAFLFESTVLDGAPVFSLFREALPAAQVLGFRGVLNSTTNLMLTRMEAGESFEEAVAHARSIGIAETDPGGDVDGWDAAVKVAALVTVLMEAPLTPAQVDRQGIRGLTSAEIERARAAGMRWKLVCSARRAPEGVEARVAPAMVGPEDPLYNVVGTSSIVQFETDVLGPLAVVERDPGPDTTAYGLLADFIHAVRG